MRSRTPFALLFALAMPFVPHPAKAYQGEADFKVCSNCNFCVHCARAGGRCSLCSAQRVSTSIHTSKSPYKKRYSLA